MHLNPLAAWWFITYIDIWRSDLLQWFLRVTESCLKEISHLLVLQLIVLFIYREIQTKTNLSFMENGDIIYYNEHKAYVFDSEKSDGRNESDMFFTLNIPLLVSVV